MTLPHNVRQLPNSAPEDIGHVVESARAAVEEELKLSERLDRKIQFQFAVAAAWFGATQAFVAAILGTRVPAGWVIAILGLAIVATGLMAKAIQTTFSVWKLRPDKALDPDDIAAFADRVHERDPTVPGEIAKHYAVVARSRRERNEERVTAVQNSFEWCAYAVAATFGELLLALAARLIPSI